MAVVHEPASRDRRSGPRTHALELGLVLRGVGMHLLRLLRSRQHVSLVAAASVHVELLDQHGLDAAN